MLWDFLHVVPGSPHPAAEACPQGTSAQLVSMCRAAGGTAGGNCFITAISRPLEKQRDSSLCSQLPVTALAVKYSGCLRFNVQIVKCSDCWSWKTFFWRLCEKPCCRRRDCRLANQSVVKLTENHLLEEKK